MSNYVRILLKEFYTAIKTEIIECYTDTDLDESVVDVILTGEGEPIYEE